MRVLIVSDRPTEPEQVLPSLLLVADEIIGAPLSCTGAAAAEGVDVVLIDATEDLAAAVTACRQQRLVDSTRPVLLVLSDGALAAVKISWGFDDWVLPRCSAAELRTRLRMLLEDSPADRSVGEGGPLEIDVERYEVRVHGRVLDLTFKEFELLRALWSRPRRVWTRQRLLAEVWEYAETGGGSRTVDVHIRRLRAKLGPEIAAMIHTVRGVGYKLEPAGAAHQQVSAAIVA